ncbi:phage baseplate protein [Heyndrickxia oleronia]|uniref:phage baseplate protein n=1 Tax=Heyndrickxia oleronia TaxID=38875 RepID=UPI001C0EAD8A|nr:hypothetical protein [Heyndrickxia oleronia]MBU5214352.1 hypothetical protein [Heyndrickxia oleronia]
MPKLGDVLIDSIKSIDLGESSDTTDHALEDGEEISDHIKNDPITLNIEGVMLDKNHAKLNKIRKYRQEGKILSFNYRAKLETVVITSFNPNYDSSIKDGYTFSMSLKQIRLAKKPNTVRVSKKVNKQVKKVTNAGRKQLK